MPCLTMMQVATIKWGESIATARPLDLYLVAQYLLTMSAEKAVYAQFVQSPALRFSELRRGTGLRSNMLAYVLNRLVRKGVLNKNGDLYELTREAVKSIPYYHDEDALSPLPVVLIRCVHQGKILLLRRNKRPYEGRWSLPGGRMLLGESVSDAAWRILRHKTFVDANIGKVRAVCNERVFDEEGPKYGFLMLVVDATPRNNIKQKQNVRWFASNQVPEDETIPSDYFFIDAPPGTYECLLDVTGEEPRAVLTGMDAHPISLQRG